jgi:hypothetical protein
MAAMVLMAAGMSITAAPATGAIMSAVPLAKAGVGSAVNDTTRELGGALGIAIFGTIVNSAYRSTVDLDGLGLSASAARAAHESVGGAVGVAHQVGGDAGAGLVQRAASAFTDAYNLAATVSVVIAVAAALLVARTFTRAKEREAASAAEPDFAPMTAMASAAPD